MGEQLDLSDFIIAEVRRQTDHDAIRKLVEVKIGDVVKRAVDDSLHSYGDVGKKITETVKKALEIGDPIDVPSYGNMVMAVLRAKMDEMLGTLINERLSTEMTEILSLAPKEVLLTKIIEAMISDLNAHDRYGSSVTCIIEDSDAVPGYWRIYLDPEAEKEKRRCETQFSITSEGKIYSLAIDGRDAKTTIVMGGMWGYKKMIFAAYCCGSKFIIDDHHPSTGIGHD